MIKITPLRVVPAVLNRLIQRRIMPMSVIQPLPESEVEEDLELEDMLDGHP